MPDNSSYPLTLRQHAPPISLPTRFAGLVLAAALALALLPQLRPVPETRLPYQALGVPSDTEVSMPAVAQVEQAPDQQGGQALVSEVASVQVESQALPPVQPALQQAAPLTPAIAPAVQAALPAPPPPAPALAPPEPQTANNWAADGITFVVQGQDWDADSYSNVEGALSSLPSRIRAQLGNRALGGLNILINRTGTSLSGKQPYGGAANYFSTNDGRNELVMFPAQSVSTVLHELGHSYNLRRIAAGRYALVLLDPEMQSFMAATGWRVLSTPEQVRAARDQMEVQFAYDGGFTWPRLSHNDPLEDFANSFSLYFFSPRELQQKSPERFAWFEANVGH